MEDEVLNAIEGGGSGMLLGASDDLLGGIELGEVVAEEQRAENGGAEELEQVGGRHAVVVVVVESGEDENRTTVPMLYRRRCQVRSGRYCPGRDSSSLYWTKYLHTSPPVGVELTRWPVRRDALVKGNNPI